MKRFDGENEAAVYLENENSSRVENQAFFQIKVQVGLLVLDYVHLNVYLGCSFQGWFPRELTPRLMPAPQILSQTSAPGMTFLASR